MFCLFQVNSMESHYLRCWGCHAGGTTLASVGRRSEQTARRAICAPTCPVRTIDFQAGDSFSGILFSRTALISRTTLIMSNIGR
jgi:hypothetical protein